MIFFQGSAQRLPFPDEYVDLVIGSPPYLGARDYRERIDGPEACPKSARPWQDRKGRWWARYDIECGLDKWVDRMLRATSEAVRVSRGLVMWVCCGVVNRGRYLPGPEHLLGRWVSENRGIAWRPLYWKKYGVPGYQKWCRSVVETALVFHAHGRNPWADPYGDPGIKKPNAGTRYGPRQKDGGRKRVRKIRRADGTRQVQVHDLATLNPELTIQTNLIEVHVGDGHLGHALAKRNEAPYPVALLKRLIPRVARPGSLILDPYIGSGTTAQAAHELGMDCIGLDWRMSQVRLAMERWEDIRKRPPGSAPKRDRLRAAKASGIRQGDLFGIDLDGKGGDANP